VTARSSGEELAQRRLEQFEDLVSLVVEARLDRRAEVIRRAAAPEGDAVVMGALAVDDEVAIVGEGLVVREADLLPETSLGERFGRDHQRVERHDGAPLSRQVGVNPSVARTT
jgi:hypothetical protein